MDAETWLKCADSWEMLHYLDEEGPAAHCRLGGHVKGCHVLDWILRK